MITSVFKRIKRYFCDKKKGATVAEPEFLTSRQGIYLRPVGSHETNPFQKPNGERGRRVAK